MKKSNKLLLAGIITVVLLIAAIHISLYAKYKAGNYTIYHAEDKLVGLEMRGFKGVSFVTIRNVSNAEVQFSDNIAVENDKARLIQCIQHGDTLVITGPDRDLTPDVASLIHITLPFNVSLTAFNSMLYFEKGKLSNEVNPLIDLHRTHAVFSEDMDSLLLGHVRIAASDSSIASFQHNTHMNSLDVQLSKSVLEFNEGDAGELSIVTDTASRISLHSKLLLKAKITTREN